MFAVWIAAAVTSTSPVVDHAQHDDARQTPSSLLAELDDAAECASACPDHAAHVRHAVALLAVGLADDALEALDRADRCAARPRVVLVSLRTADAPAAERHAVRGAALMALGDCRAAGAELDRALRSDAGCVRAHLTIGHFAARTGQFAGAAVHFGEVVRHDPAHPEARTSLGAARLRLGDPAGWADLDAGIRLAPRAAAAWEARGVARGESGDHAGAAEDFARALRFEPRPGCVAGLARARSLLGDYDGVDRAVSVGLALTPGNPDRARLLAIRADAHAARGNHAAAAADLDRALVYAPDAPELVAARERLAGSDVPASGGRSSPESRWAIDPSQN